MYRFVRFRAALSLLLSALVSSLAAGQAPPPATVTELLRAAGDDKGKVEDRVAALQEIVRSEATRHVLDSTFRGTHFDAAQVVPVLLGCLKDESHLARRAAAEALGWYGPDERTVPALIEALKDTDDGRPYDGTVASCAADSLGLLGARARDAVPALVAAAKTRHELLTPSATRSLAEIAAEEKSVTGDVVAALTSVLHDNEQNVGTRTAAVKALGALGAQAKAAVSELRTVLRAGGLPPPMDPVRDPDCRREILRALAQIGPEARDATPELVAILQDKNEAAYYRSEAARALGTLGPGAGEAVPALQAAIQEKDYGPQPEARRALALIQLRDEREFLDSLLKTAKDGDPAGQTAAVKTIRDNSYGTYPLLPAPRRQEITSILLLALKAGPPEARRMAAEALQWYGSDERVVPTLVAVLRDKDVGQLYGWSVAQAAAYSLGRMGAREAVPTLIEAAEHGDWRLAPSAQGALGHIATKHRAVAPAVVPVIVAILKDQKRSHSDHFTAINVLGTIGPPSKAAVPVILKALKSKKAPPGSEGAAFRSNVLMDLGRIGPGAEEAVPVLATIVQDKYVDFPVRQRAAEALGHIGRASRPAVPALLEVIHECSPASVRVFRIALARIER